MDSKIRRAALLMLLLFLSITGCGKKQPVLSEAVKQTVQYQLETVPRPESASLGGEWTLLSVMRSGEEIPKSYGEIYLSNLEKRLKETDGVLSKKKYTEYARAALAVASLGENPGDVAGYDLLAPLADLEQVTDQGINGAAFALLAWDTRDPAAEETEKALLDWILEQELPGGGFSLNSEERENPDTDITAMVLQAAAPYQNEEKIAPVVERAVEVLAQAQRPDGTYEAMGEVNSETVSQVLIALSALGIDGQTDSRFVKGEKGLYDVLMTFSDGKGGFSHVPDGQTDPMATDQALCALDAYQRYQNGENSLYDMSDCSSQNSQ